MIAGLGLKVQDGAGLEEKSTPHDFKDGRIGPGQAEAVGTQRVIADDDGAKLDARRRAAIFGQAGGDIAEADRDGRGIGIDIGGRCVDPELRMSAIATALFIDDVQ